MKKTVLSLLGIVTILGAGLASCGSNNKVEFNDAESRNLRLASGIGLIANQNASVKRAAGNDKFASQITMALPSLDIVVENDFHVDAKLEGKEGEQKFTYNGANYSFKETIKYLDQNEKGNDIVLYYNYVNTAESKKFTENIEGVVTVNETSYVNFTSTASLEEGHSKRDLSLYIGKESNTSLVISEETIVSNEKIDHKFKYTFKLLGSELMSYSINLDKANTTMSVKVATLSFNLTRTETNGNVTYVALTKESLTGLEIKFTFVKEVVDGTANYKVTVDASTEQKN